MGFQITWKNSAVIMKKKKSHIHKGCLVHLAWRVARMQPRLLRNASVQEKTRELWLPSPFLPSRVLLSATYMVYCLYRISIALMHEKFMVDNGQPNPNCVRIQRFQHGTWCILWGWGDFSLERPPWGKGIIVLLLRGSLLLSHQVDLDLQQLQSWCMSTWTCEGRWKSGKEFNL